MGESCILCTCIVFLQLGIRFVLVLYFHLYAYGFRIFAFFFVAMPVKLKPVRADVAWHMSLEQLHRGPPSMCENHMPSIVVSCA